MRFVVLSDTHGKHTEISHLPDADAIIHAGDVSNKGELWEIREFLDWFVSLPYKHKILIAGNHDRYLDSISKIQEKEIFEKIIYLNDSGIEINGIKIWGSPIQPTYNNWAFNRNRGSEIKQHWKLIPKGVDIVVTHGPSYGYQDKTISNLHVGCRDLLETIQKIKPKYHVFGHIHESYGMFEDSDMGITFINASLVDVKKRLNNEPILIELDKENRLAFNPFLLRLLKNFLSPIASMFNR